LIPKPKSELIFARREEPYPAQPGRFSNAHRSLGYNYVSLADLISTKLGSFLANPIRRSKDKTAVIELKRNGLPRSIPGLHPAIKNLYCEIWEQVAAEPEGPRA
jgi:hypothetical protein